MSKEVARNISYRDYYERWGYLPPGFEIEINGQKIIGGCAKWREYADQMGYPQDPPPWATAQEKAVYQRFLDKTYRPWMHGDEPIQEKFYKEDCLKKKWRPVIIQGFREDD